MIVKLTSDGEEVWRRTWKGNTDEVLYSVKVHGGYVYAAGDTTHPEARGEGWSPAAGSEREWKMKGLVLKYDLDGQYIWHKVLDLGDMTALKEIVVQDGSMYVAGFVESEGGEQRDILVAKLSPDDGSLEWANTWDGGCDERTVRMTVFDQGIYVAGQKLCESPYSLTGVLLKFDLNGNLVWVREWSGRGYAFYSGVWSDGDAIYALGATRTDDTQWSDWSIAAYSPDGELLWVKKITRPRASSSFKGLPIDLTGDREYFYVAGMLYPPTQGDPQDAIVVKVLREGETEGEQGGGAGVGSTADLLSVAAPEVALVNRFLKLDITVTNPGPKAERYMLELVHETGGVLTSKEIDVPPGESRETTLMVVPVEVGPLELTVRLVSGGAVLEEEHVTVEVVKSLPESPSPTPTQTPPPTQATPSPTPTESPSPTPAATEEAEGEGEGGIPKAALAVGAVAVAAAAAALALKGRKPGAPAPAPAAPAAQPEESEEIRKIREKLEALERAKAEGRISERTYRELRDKYENELEKLLGGA